MFLYLFHNSLVQALETLKEAVQEAVEDDQAYLLKKSPEKDDTSDLRQTAAAKRRIFVLYNSQGQGQAWKFYEKHGKASKKKCGIFH